MKIFLDFDDTLFNTKAFGERLRRVFDAHGIPRDVQARTATALKDGTAGGWYSPEKHIALLAEACHFDDARLRSDIDDALLDMQGLLFPGVVDFLSLMKERSHTLFIISYGDRAFQMKKIHGTGIEHFFEKILVTQEDKVVALDGEHRAEKEDTWFVEDRVRYIASVKKTWPGITTVLMCQADGRYRDIPDEFCDFVVTTWGEVTQAIDELIVLSKR